MLHELVAGVMDKYASASYMTQQKARIFLYMVGLIFLLIIAVSIALNLTVDTAFLSSRNAMRMSVLVFVAIAYVLLRSGRYGIAVNLAIFGSLAVMGIQVVTAEYASSLEFANRLYVMYVFVILTALFSTVWSTLASMVIVIAVTVAAGLNAPSLPAAEVKNTIINFTVSLSIISVISLILMRVVDTTISRIEESLHKEREHTQMKKLLGTGLSLSRELSSMSDGLNEENRNLSQRTVEHAAALEEVSATIEETVVTLQHSTESTGKASLLAEEATRIAEEGVKMISGAVDFIKDVDRSGEKIAQITDLINDIAFQTNILALNAAIEAARAGRAGRGFAVVAGEVRNLAGRAAEAAREISGLIGQSISRIHQGAELVAKSGGALSNISTSVREVDAMVKEITRQSDEQQRGIEEIRVSISQMDQVVQENSALVERTSAVSDTLSRQARDLMSVLQSNEALAAG